VASDCRRTALAAEPSAPHAARRALLRFVMAAADHHTVDENFRARRAGPRVATEPTMSVAPSVAHCRNSRSKAGERQMARFTSILFPEGGVPKGADAAPVAYPIRTSTKSSPR